MSIAEPVALVLAFVYVSVVLAIGEGLRRLFRFSVEFTRKFVHVAVGMIAFPLVWLFRDWYWAIIPPLVFILVNYMSYRRQIFQGMETGEKNQLGTVYFPISFSILIPLLWSQPALLVASLMPMTWGDAFAAIVGRRWGAHTYSDFGQTRSLEGSVAMLALSFIATTVALIVFGQPLMSSLVWGLLTAVVATFVEAFSPWGIDNLTVPLTSALVLVIASNLAGK
jgi:phytol kinase